MNPSRLAFRVIYIYISAVCMAKVFNTHRIGKVVLEI